MKLGALFSVSLSALGLLACSSSSGGEDVPRVALEDVPAMYAEALCKAYESCLGPLAEIYLPGEDCVQRTTDKINDGWGSIEAAVDAKRIAYDGTRVEGCIADIEARSCEELLQRDPDACSAAFEGTVAEGEDCSQSEECQGAAYCKFGSSCPGTCSALEASGGTCKSDSQCASGLVCSEDTERCVTPAAAGEACGGSEPECAPGFFCKGADSDKGTSGSCESFEDVFSAGSGAACDIMANDFCDSDLGCAIDGVTADGTIEASCSAKVGSGDACKIAIPSLCPADEYCNVPAAVPVTFEGECQPRPGAGDDCAKATPFDMAGSVCGAYLRCDGGKCRALASLGETCETNDVCLSEHCAGGACVSGDACD